jgi:hypothetical protein
VIILKMPSTQFVSIETLVNIMRRARKVGVIDSQVPSVHLLRSADANDAEIAVNE